MPKPRVQIGLRVSPDLLAELDRQRMLVPRETWLRWIIVQHLSENGWEPDADEAMTKIDSQAAKS